MLQTTEGFDRLELRVSGRICVLAPMNSRGFDGLAHDVTWNAWRRFEQLPLDRRSADALRTFWARYGARAPRKRLSDRELQIEVARAIRQGSLGAAVFVDPGGHVHARDIPEHSGPMAHPGVQAAASAASPPGAPPPLARTALGAPAPAAPKPGPQPLPGAAAAAAVEFDPAWTLTQKVNVVVRIAASQLPEALGQQLLGLISPENIGIVVGGFAVAVAAHLTGVGEVADVVLGGLALAFGGWAALGALKSLWTSARLTVQAKGPQDLKDAGAALAAAVSVLGVLGLFAILHAVKGRPGGAVEEGAAPKLEKTAPKAPPEKAAAEPSWPPNCGFLEDPKPKELPVGTRVDRYGYEGGTFVSPEGTPVEARSLAPGTTDKLYNIYEVTKPIEVQSGQAAPWFGQPGMGVQYEMPTTVGEALANGSLKRVGP